MSDTRNRVSNVLDEYRQPHPLQAITKLYELREKARGKQGQAMPGD